MNRVEAFLALFADPQDSLTATEEHVTALRGAPTLTNEDEDSLPFEVIERIRSFQDDPDIYLASVNDPAWRALLSEVRPAPPIDLAPAFVMRVVADPSAAPAPIVAQPPPDDPPPDPPPREPPPREPPQAPELPHNLRQYLVAVRLWAPDLVAAVACPEWPAIRKEVEEAHRAAQADEAGAWLTLILLPPLIQGRTQAATRNVALAKAAYSYAQAAVGNFSHPDYHTPTLLLAWRIAAGHPHVP